MVTAVCSPARHQTLRARQHMHLWLPSSKHTRGHSGCFATVCGVIRVLIPGKPLSLLQLPAWSTIQCTSCSTVVNGGMLCTRPVAAEAGSCCKAHWLAPSLVRGRKCHANQVHSAGTLGL